MDAVIWRQQYHIIREFSKATGISSGHNDTTPSCPPWQDTSCTFTSNSGVGDTIGVVYLPANPAKYAIADTRGGFTAMLIFCIILFLFVLFAVYKINGMVQRGEM